MKPRNTLLCCLLLITSLYAQAQTQQGYVKTIGRPNKPGVGVPNATVQIMGAPNAVLTDSEGRFQVVLSGKKEGDELVVLSVRKAGYELRDKESSGRKLVFSTQVPVYILMVDSRQLAADKQRIEEKAYQVAEENYQRKVAELEQQLSDKAIAAEHYRQQLAELQRKYESYLSLIDGMADRYARTDYDQLDSIDRAINLCIENGELDKADSLIHTVFDPETVLERNHAAKEAVQQRIAFAQSVIDKAQADKAALLRDRDYAARVVTLCLNLADEYQAAGNPDDAKRCLNQALEIQTALYGAESPEADAIRTKINTCDR